MFKNLKLFVFVFISLMTVFITSCTPPSAPELPPVPQAPAYDWHEDYSEVTLDTVKVTGTVNYSTSEPTESTYSTFYFDGSKWYRRNGSSDELVLESLSRYLSLFVTTNPIGDYKKDELCAIIGTYIGIHSIDNAVYQYGRYTVNYTGGNDTCIGLCTACVHSYVDFNDWRYVGGGNDVEVESLDKFGYILYANGTIEITSYGAGGYVNTAIGAVTGPLPIYVYSTNSSN